MQFHHAYLQFDVTGLQNGLAYMRSALHGCKPTAHGGEVLVVRCIGRAGDADGFYLLRYLHNT